MAQVTGRIFIDVAGISLRSKPGAKLELGGRERDASMSDDGIDGFTDRVVAPKIECRINHTADTNLTKLGSIEYGKGVFQTDTGRVYTVRNVWSSKPPTLVGGEVSLEFSGTECIED